MLHLDKWNMAETFRILSHPERRAMQARPTASILCKKNPCRIHKQEDTEMKQTLYYASAYKEMVDTVQEKPQIGIQKKKDDDFFIYDEIYHAGAFSIE
jgi:hypothetical protein